MGWDEVNEVYAKYYPFETDDGNLLFQYRSLDGFWSIVEADSFWATNARFSNDEEEQRLGVEKVSEAFSIGKGKADKDEDIKLFRDCYIVCFCKKDDKLSQWRGYAQNGVSIGFDFSNPRPFFVMGDDGKESILYNMCIHVFYFNERTSKETIYEKLELTEEVYHDCKELWDRRLINCVPFIKHEGFSEEEEYRLVFNGDGIESFIRYRNSSDNRKIPYIVVKCGAVKKSKKTVIRIMFDSDTDERKEWKRIIKEAVRTEKDVILIDCQNKSVSSRKKKYCDGCTKVRRVNLREGYTAEEWCDCPGKAGYVFKKADDIILSDSDNQKEIYELLYDALHKNGLSPKIWCEGHLPIRSITVGPTRDKKQIAESISHFCKHKAYWLRDVEVKESKIPYRS